MRSTGTNNRLSHNLIGHDMERDSIMAGYRDLAAGRIFASSGDFHEDIKILAKKETADWQ
jgi:antitoxin ParD1/3/4